jgi:hypothetical protein
MLSASSDAALTSGRSSCFAGWLAELSLEFLAEWELFWIVALIGLGVFLLFTVWKGPNSKAWKDSRAQGQLRLP